MGAYLNDDEAIIFSIMSIVLQRFGCRIMNIDDDTGDINIIGKSQEEVDMCRYTIERSYSRIIEYFYD